LLREVRNAASDSDMAIMCWLFGEVSAEGEEEGEARYVRGLKEVVGVHWHDDFGSSHDDIISSQTH
jgi:hypothetical protein